eukprot:CAMPEP_0185853204 /NCGR_PEP_ID=MMETSP1354-20130828/18090_1 /TAXON_ID=708628 /ORGANISM="Erythrolobus madagascarensis, Strain CCMP3276" /LENGTH=84 /DNA_ID=CAMNT_0028554641 /DNA_START=212 /DNA_END=462 /DNA_ORIENTATION=+
MCRLPQAQKRTTQAHRSFSICEKHTSSFSKLGAEVAVAAAAGSCRDEPPNLTSVSSSGGIGGEADRMVVGCGLEDEWGGWCRQT